MSNLQKIQKAVYAACPELLELSLGCKVQVRNEIRSRYDEAIIVLPCNGIGWWYCLIPSKTSRGGAKLHAFKQKHFTQILGHDIQLHHVLRTIEQKIGKETEIDKLIENPPIVTRKKELVQRMQPYLKDLFVFWDLTRDLASQSEDTLTFLAQLLG